MELSEAANRIFRQHYEVIAYCLLIGLLGTVLLHRGEVPLYSASTRFVLDTTDPQSQAQSQAISDTARAIVTGPGQVASALREIGVHRDVLEVADHHISVETLGSSGVLNLSVTDPDPAVAVSLANALAGEVITTRLAASNGAVTQALHGLDSQINRLTGQIAAADRKVKSLDTSIAATGNTRKATILKAERDARIQTKDYLAERRAVLESERANIGASDALRPQPSVIEPAVAPAQPLRSHWLYKIALGVMFGLFLGIGIAVLLEIFRPTVVGPGAIAELIGGPLLGVLPAPPDKLNASELEDVATHVGVAAAAARVDRIELAGVEEAHLTAFAQMLEAFLVPLGADLHALTGAASPARRDGGNGKGHTLMEEPSWVAVDALDRRGVPSVDGRKRAGLIIIAPTAVKRAALQHVNDFVQIFGWPRLGVIAYRQRPGRRWAASGRSATALRSAAGESRG